MKTLYVALAAVVLAACVRGPRVHDYGTLPPPPIRGVSIPPAPVNARAFEAESASPTETASAVPEEHLPAAKPARDEASAVAALQASLQDVFFAYDRFDLAADARHAIEHDAALLRDILQEFPRLTIAVEGHCDERGSAEYNLGLGDFRASAARRLLHELSVPENSLRAVSFGKERPQCSDANESCYAQNRRVHLAVSRE